MLNKRLLMVMIALIGLLIGCSKQPDKGDYIIEKAQQQSANSLTLGDVTKTLAEKVELMPIATLEKDWILNNVEPNRFRVGKAAENTDPAKLEQISIYIFRTENERKKGLDDFNKQKEAYDMLIPRIYEAQNAMMFYWSGASSDKPTKFGQEFEDAFYQLGN